MLRTNFEPSPELFPFARRWLSSSAGRLHYVDEGDGRPVLLLHGNPTWSFLYRKMIPALCNHGMRCIAPDLLGYGLSDHPDDFGYTAAEQAALIVELVEALDLRDAVVVGQDWGGPIGLAAAAAVADRVGGVVVGSTFAWRTTGLTRAIGRVFRWRRVQRWMTHGESFVDRVVGSMAQVDLTSQELAHYREVASTVELRSSLAVLPLQLIDADAWLEQLEREVVERLGDRPTLLVRAHKDAIGQAAARRFERMFADHTHVDLPKAGHFFQEDAPAEVAAAIVARFGCRVAPENEGRAGSRPRLNVKG